MSQPTAQSSALLELPLIESGLGTCCAEAQADGVPCVIMQTDCTICDRALARARDASVAILPIRAADVFAK